MRRGFGTFVTVLSLLLTPSLLLAQADPAREHFESGVRLLDDSKFADAAAALERSLALRESPPVLFNLGLAYRGLGRYKDAIARFERFLAIADKSRYAAQRERVGSELEALRRGLVRLTLVVRGGATQVKLDGEVIGSRDETHELKVDPGRHEVIVQRPGHRAVQKQITLAPGERRKLELDAGKTPLPARLVIDVDATDAVILLDGKNVGRGRFDGKIAAGAHRLRVTAPDRDPHERRLLLSPGETARQDVRLAEQDGSIFGTWWFWAGSAVVVGAAVTGVILLQRPEPEEPRRGSLGVLVEAFRR